jgi:hypothetical protein
MSTNMCSTRLDISSLRLRYVQRVIKHCNFGVEVTLAQHLLKVCLGMTHGAVVGAVVVAPFGGLAVATEGDAHQPAVSSAPNDLSRLLAKRSPPTIWHTAGTPAWGEPLG